MVNLPDFIVIGAPRSGTTSLFFYLKQHPEIFLPKRKELHYFSSNLLFENVAGPGDRDALGGICATWEEYISYYSSADDELIVGEISPSYLYFCEVSECIREKLGEVKIIASLRNPVEKAFSHYQWLKRTERETLSFYDALMAETQRQAQGWGDMWRYAEGSLYADRIKKYLSVFGTKNVKIILAEELFTTPDKVMEALLAFLSVDTKFVLDTSISYNRSGQQRSQLIVNFFSKPNRLREFMKQFIPPAIRAKVRMTILDANTAEKEIMDKESEEYLKSYFHEDILRLERIIGRRTGWLNDSRTYA